VLIFVSVSSFTAYIVAIFLGLGLG